MKVSSLWLLFCLQTALFPRKAQAFSSSTIVSPKSAATSLPWPFKDALHTPSSKRSSACPPLKYREHDGKDSDTTLIKLESRTPSIGYDVKKEIQATGSQSSRSTGLNEPLVKALLLNQGITIVAGTAVSALTLAVSDGCGSLGHFSDITQWANPSFALVSGANPFLLGALGAVPSIVIGSIVESSDKQAFANTNFSTIIMVMTLFGRRRAPPDEFLPPQARGTPFPSTTALDVALASVALATATAIAEETVFRSGVAGLLAHFNDERVFLALFGQAFLFGLGHISPKSDLMENGVVAGLQATNGLCFGVLYLLSGGNLLPCIVAQSFS
jgi:membrane protease YdiL (CAAX protease family)